MAEQSQRFDPLECVVCGLCLEVCPTYEIRRDEGSGPRGRIRLMELLAAGQSGGDWTLPLEECVGCLACEARCPAGVPYGGMLDEAHAHLVQRAQGRFPSSRWAAWALDHLLPFPARLAKLRIPLGVLLATRLLKLARLMRMERLPGMSWLSASRWLPRHILIGKRGPGPRRGAERLFFPGCVGGLFYSEEEGAARKLLAALGGYDRVGGSLCCGAVHRHLGLLDKSRELARRNIAAYESKPGLVITVAAGCGAALKNYVNWLADDPEWALRAARFSARVRDFNEVLAEDLAAGRFRFHEDLARPRRVVYDDPCHAVHGQGVAQAPRDLLDALPGISRAELPHADRCCGAGGSYFLRQPQLSKEMIKGRLRDLAATEARFLLTSNPGCRLQWESALAESGWKVELRHPAELWAEALDEGCVEVRSP